MKPLSRAIIVLGTLTVLTMGLYPPWIATATVWNGSLFKPETRQEELTVKNAGYHFVMESPGQDIEFTRRLFQYTGKDGMEHRGIVYSINTPRLFVQWAIVILLTLGFLWVNRSTSKLNSPTQD